MRESSEPYKLHLVYRLSPRQERVEADVLGRVRALEDVTSVTAALSHDTSTRLAFSTPCAHVVSAAVKAKQCLHTAIDAHNAQRWWWQKVHLVDEPAVQQVA